MQEYHAAADEQRRNSKPGLMTGLFNTLDEPTDTDPNVEQLQNLSLSLPAPAPSQEVGSSQLLYMFTAGLSFADGALLPTFHSLSVYVIHTALDSLLKVATSPTAESGGHASAELADAG